MGGSGGSAMAIPVVVRCEDERSHSGYGGSECWEGVVIVSMHDIEAVARSTQLHEHSGGDCEFAAWNRNAKAANDDAFPMLDSRLGLRPGVHEYLDFVAREHHAARELANYNLYSAELRRIAVCDIGNAHRPAGYHGSGVPCVMWIGMRRHRVPSAKDAR
jgi:hypothetical protein